MTAVKVWTSTSASILWADPERPGRILYFDRKEGEKKHAGVGPSLGGTEDPYVRFTSSHLHSGKHLMLVETSCIIQPAVDRFPESREQTSVPHEFCECEDGIRASIHSFKSIEG